MNGKIKKLVRPAVFAAAGALAGLAYWYFAGCSGGSCAITSRPGITMAYTGVIGLLLSAIFDKRCDKCSM